MKLKITFHHNKSSNLAIFCLQKAQFNMQSMSPAVNKTCTALCHSSDHRHSSNQLSSTKIEPQLPNFLHLLCPYWLACSASELWWVQKHHNNPHFVVFPHNLISSLIYVFSLECRIPPVMLDGPLTVISSVSINWGLTILSSLHVPYSPLYLYLYRTKNSEEFPLTLILGSLCLLWGTGQCIWYGD